MSAEMRIEVGNPDGTWSVLNRGAHGQDEHELTLMAERWQALQMFGGARIRVAEGGSEERRAAAPAPARVVRAAVPVAVDEEEVAF